MNVLPLSAETTVASALERSPAIQGILVARRAACVGCCMARFCTLRDVATAYELPWDALIGELGSPIPEHGPTIGGSSA